MVALVEGLNSKEFGQVFRGGGGALVALPVDSGGVVGPRVDGSFMKVKGVDQHILLGNGSCEFQVRVGNGACGMIPGDEGSLNLWGELFTP